MDRTSGLYGLGAPDTSHDKHECAPENAAKMLDWIRTRGGVAIWRSVNLSNPGASWSAPVRAADSRPYPKPTWEAESQPSRIITDPSEIEVVTRREVRRFRVAIRAAGASVMSFKLTDASTRKVREAVDKAGDGASYEFDYTSQEAIITVPGERVLLSEWVPQTPQPQETPSP